MDYPILNKLTNSKSGIVPNGWPVSICVVKPGIKLQTTSGILKGREFNLPVSQGVVFTGMSGADYFIQFLKK